jgi:hypothetical protein
MLRHFKRNRKYSRKERWLVVTGLLGLTLAVASFHLAGQFFDKAEAANVEVQYVGAPNEPIKSNGEDSGIAEITLVKSGSTIPAINLWVGLKPKNKNLATAELSYNDWYSPAPSRAFFKTNARGQVTFPLMSEKAGEIVYDIYLATLVNDEIVDYQKLGETVTAKFIAPEASETPES